MGRKCQRITVSGIMASDNNDDTTSHNVKNEDEDHDDVDEMLSAVALRMAQDMFQIYIIS